MFRRNPETADLLARIVSLEIDLEDARREPRRMRLSMSEALYGTATAEMPFEHMTFDAHHAMVDRANALASLVLAQSEIDRLRTLLAQAYPVVDHDLAEMIRQALDGTLHEVG